MIEVMILGFLAEGPLHGYELRRRMAQLHGYARTISDGTIYPAINRLITAGALTEEIQPGTGAAQRRTLHLTRAGLERLVQRLRDARGHDITDPGRFFVVLAFLSLVPDEGDRRAVLARRLAYLERPVSFFSDGGRPLRAADIKDPYRRGILVSAIASNRAERAWLREQLDPSATETKDTP
ncbi:MAG: PadR family transcriptional regulator [Micropruina sp.]|nr:PadR family transcriptional regulator [Micropruina sp.]